MNFFDFDTIEDFDKHISTSIPSYNELIRTVSFIVECLCTGDLHHLDIGCSTGEFVLENIKKGIKSIGIDKSTIIKKHENLVKDDFLSYTFNKKFNIITSIFFLQFLNNVDRQKAFDKIKILLNSRGYLIICEKIFYSSGLIGDIIETSYLNRKLDNFTHKEILEKKIQLSKTMFLQTKKELERELLNIGIFTQFWQSYNFVGYIVRAK